MFVKPAGKLVNGKPLQVRDPKTKMQIPASGLEVPDGDTYWNRRIAEGDVVIAPPPVVLVDQNPIPDSTPSLPQTGEE